MWLVLQLAVQVLEQELLQRLSLSSSAFPATSERLGYWPSLELVQPCQEGVQCQGGSLHAL